MIHKKIKTLPHCWGEWKMVQPLWKTVWRCPRKSKTELLCGSAAPLWGVHSRELEARTGIGICTPLFTAVWLTPAQSGKHGYTNVWYDVCIWYTRTLEYYSVSKRYSDTHWTLMNLELCIMLSEKTQSQNVMWYRILFTQNVQNIDKSVETESRLLVVKGDGVSEI